MRLVPVTELSAQVCDAEDEDIALMRYVRLSARGFLQAAGVVVR